MKIAVSGASGFVGSHLCLNLKKIGYQVLGLVRSKPASGQVAIGDFCSSENNYEFLRDIDVLVHSAARVHVMKDTSINPLAKFREVNVDATLNLARRAADCGVKRFIFLSSIKVNGEITCLGRPFTAEDIPDPSDPYGISKREAEDGLRDLANQTKMEVVIIRSPLVYGPGVKANFLTMMQYLKLGIPLPFGGIKENRRSLVALDNLVDFICLCISHPQAGNQTFLISDDEDLSTEQLLRRLGGAIGTSARLIYIPPKLIIFFAKLVGRIGISQRLCGSLQIDISKAKNLLGWKPIVTVDEALRSTAKYWLNNNDKI